MLFAQSFKGLIKVALHTILQFIMLPPSIEQNNSFFQAICAVIDNNIEIRKWKQWLSLFMSSTCAFQGIQLVLRSLCSSCYWLWKKYIALCLTTIMHKDMVQAIRVRIQLNTHIAPSYHKHNSHLASLKCLYPSVSFALVYTLVHLEISGHLTFGASRLWDWLKWDDYQLSLFWHQYAVY